MTGSRVSLQQVTDRIGDGLHGTPKYSEMGDIPFINGNNLKSGRISVDAKTRYVCEDEYEKHAKSLNERTVLLSINGTIGNVAQYRGEKVVLGKSACYLNCNEEIAPRFLVYLLKDRVFQGHIKQTATGTTIKNVSLALVREYEFDLPNMSDQRAIAHILGTLDDKIEVNRKMNQTLEDIAKAIFKSWFVDFDPVRAKAEGRPTGLPPEISDLFPDQLVDSEIGEIPKGWESTRISKIAKKVSEKYKKGEDWSEEKLIDLSRMPSKSIALNAHGKGAELSTSVCKFKKYDFLFGSIRPYFYKAGICPFDGVSNTSVFILRSIEDFDREFIYLYSSSDQVFEQSIQYSDGTKMPIIKWQDFQDFSFALPDKTLRKHFSEIVRPMVEKVDVQR